jgi:hypothetical protein
MLINNYTYVLYLLKSFKKKKKRENIAALIESIVYFTDINYVFFLLKKILIYDIIAIYLFGKRKIEFTPCKSIHNYLQ